MTFLDTTKRALIALAATVAFATPSLALDIQAPDLNPGPQFDYPDEVAPPQNGGGNGGGHGGQGGSQPAHNGGENTPHVRIADPCPNGEMHVSFEFDDDGHPIPTSFSRTCVITR